MDANASKLTNTPHQTSPSELANRQARIATALTEISIKARMIEEIAANTAPEIFHELSTARLELAAKALAVAESAVRAALLA
jgi:hypothetical protein